MTAELTYLDYNATAPLRTGARESMLAAANLIGNPSSVHRFGRAARRVVEVAREQVARMVGTEASADSVIFTSGGTEANAMVLRSFRRRPQLASAVEHPSVLENANDPVLLPVASDGVVDLDAAREAIVRHDAPLVSVMAANNETGVLQPIEELAGVVRNAGGLLHVDAIQLAGKLPLSQITKVADLITLSAHKIGGPMGVGALVVMDHAPGGPAAVTPLIAGGGQERRRRSGTENLPGIAGFGAAAKEIALSTDEGQRLAELRDRLEAGVRAACPDAVIYGTAATRLPNTSCIGLPGLSGETQVMALDLAGVAVSAGAACSSGKVQKSHVLSAMGVPDDAAGSAIRVSLGWGSSPRDVEMFLSTWTELAERRRAA